MKNGLDISNEGTKRWYKDGKLHKEDGPAIEYTDGTLFWYQNGKFHREDGPAVRYVNGSNSWYINDIELSEDQFNKWRIQNRKEKIEALNL